MNTIRLPGCRPEPLLSYLKALGVFRLVAEQKDPAARAAWEDDVLVLHTVLGEEQLVEFFIHEYKPTPIVVPWNGEDFFEAENVAFEGDASQPPKGAEIIAAFRSTDTPRLATYRETINIILESFRRLKLTREKPPKGSKGQSAKLKMGDREVKSEEVKALLITTLRSWVPNETVQWIDATTVISDDKPNFNALLGSGGNDGNMNFADNFMQNIWDALPDFDDQRSNRRKRLADDVLHNSLFKKVQFGVLFDRNPAFFDPAALGGENATQGFSRGPLMNPWDFILGVEGTLCLAGAVSRRLASQQKSQAIFPFTVESRLGGGHTASTKDRGQEFWMPMWSRPLGLKEMLQMFSEGRAEVRRRPASDGVDFARAVASYGVDRGISTFVRYAIIEGRRGGRQRNAAVIERFFVTPQPHIDCLTNLDSHYWLNNARSMCEHKHAPERFGMAFRRLENAIVDCTRNGNSTTYAELLATLGNFERELSRNAEKCGQINSDKKLTPVPLLSPEWLEAANDNSIEFSLAVALASVASQSGALGPLREHLEPASLKWDRWDWRENTKGVVWSSASLSQNLLAVLERRLMESERANLDTLQFWAKRFATPQDIMAFLSDHMNERRLEELLWGAMLIDWNSIEPKFLNVKGEDLLMLPRSFALLKIPFLLGKHTLVTASGRPMKPEAATIANLRAGRVGRACEITSQRLVASGYDLLARSVQTSEWQSEQNAVRLAAALLIPLALPAVRPNQISPLAQLVLHDSTPITE